MIILKKIARKLWKNAHHSNDRKTLIEVRVDTSKILENYNFYKERCKTDVLPVLKSNAYGHGIAGIAYALEKNDEALHGMVVDSLFEADQLRNIGISTTLMVIGYTDTESMMRCVSRNIIFTITSLEQLKDLVEKCKNQSKMSMGLLRHQYNLKIDTGMMRQGIRWDDSDIAFAILQDSNLPITSICTHLASADTDSDFSATQVERWRKIIEKVESSKKLSEQIKHMHVLATEGCDHIDDTRYTSKSNVSRLGLGLYLGHKGANPALSMYTVVTGVKKVRKGETIGYSGTYKAENDMTIATIPVGYYEGLDRRLSNKGIVQVIVEGKAELAPIVGRVSMNISSIDISRFAEKVKIGTEVCVISHTKGDPNTVEKMAELCDTIPYEILVHIPQHLKRVYT